jgi:hypothetical protein
LVELPQLLVDRLPVVDGQFVLVTSSVVVNLDHKPFVVVVDLDHKPFVVVVDLDHKPFVTDIMAVF